MAKKNKARRGSKFNISVLTVAGLAPYVNHSVVEPVRNGEGLGGVMKRIPKAIGYDGYTGQFGFQYVRQSGILFAIAGVLGHKVANRIGLNNPIRKLTGGVLSL